MIDPDPTTEDPSAEERPEARTGEAGGGDPLVEADLLVEEVSIDGMCGVY